MIIRAIKYSPDAPTLYKLIRAADDLLIREAGDASQMIQQAVDLIAKRAKDRSQASALPTSG